MFFKTLKILGLVALVVTISSCTLSVLPPDNNNNAATAYEYSVSKSSGETLWYYDKAELASSISDKLATAETYVQAVDGAVDLSVDSVFFVFNSEYTSAILYVYLATKNVVRVESADWVLSGGTISSETQSVTGTATFGTNRGYFTITSPH